MNTKISRNNFIIIGLLIIFLILLGYLFSIQYRNNSTDIKCPDGSEKYECWRQILDETLEQKGLVASFDILEELYETEPEFASECHSYTHELGERSYKLFSIHKDIEMTEKASYCGYGFYHGFVETLLHSGAPIKEAQDFCLYADKQLSAYGSKTSIACYHGIGHGAVDGSDPRNWGDPQKLIEPGLSICSTVSVLPEQIYQCGTGVFNALTIALNGKLFNLKQVEADPYEICLNQTEDFIRSCYEQMNSRVSNLSNGNFDEAVKFVMNIPDKKYSIIAMEQLAPAMIASKVGQNYDFSNEVKTCNTMPEYLQQPCINGLAGGILEFGKPNYEYVEAIDFCELPVLNEEQNKACIHFVVANSRVIYSSEKAEQICAMIDGKYELNCNK